MTNDEGTCENSEDPLQSKYKLSPEEAMKYLTRVKERLGVEKIATFNLFIIALRSYNREKLTRDEVVSHVGEIFKEEPDMLEEFKNLVVR